MVRISSARMKQQTGGGGGSVNKPRNRHDKGYDPEKVGALGLGFLVVGYVAWSLFLASSGGGGDVLDPNNAGRSGGDDVGPNHPDLGVSDPNSESYNAIASDIIQTLKCRDLLNMTAAVERSYGGMGDANDYDDGLFPNNENENKGEEEGGESGGRIRRRRLQREEDQAVGGADFSGEDGGGGDMPGYDDGFDMMGENAEDWVEVTAEHLFCVAAYSNKKKSDVEITSKWKPKIQCDAGTNQKSLLELWSTIRAELPDENKLKKVLGVSTETERNIAGIKTLNLWSPRDDNGLDYMLAVVNDEEKKSVDDGGLYGLSNNLGPHRLHGSNNLFVDVGSCLGVTSMAVALLYPGTRILSVEAAAPNYLLQEMNWICNAGEFDNLNKEVVLAGVGPTSTDSMQRRQHATTSQMAKFMWRPQATTSTRAWTPAEEYDPDTHLELLVKLKPWHSILAEADIYTPGTTVDVLNVDCEGCEYNLIPALSQREYDDIQVVMGGIHWGYLRVNKLPSSRRGKTTHERLCKHENFARTAIECCQFPDMEVVSSVAGEILIQEDGRGGGGTVADVAGSLCDKFDEWAVEHHLHDVQSDYGWFQLTSMAD